MTIKTKALDKNIFSGVNVFDFFPYGKLRLFKATIFFWTSCLIVIMAFNIEHLVDDFIRYLGVFRTILQKCIFRLLFSTTLWFFG